MLSELFGLLSSVDVSSKGKTKKFGINLNKNRIGSISAFSSNSIFYFPEIVSDQCTPEEVAMITRMIEKSCASFVVACISLMPFHRIQADDRASIEEYLTQFHQNLGINPGSGPIVNKLFGAVSNISESANCTDKEFAEFQDFLMECWNKAKKENSDFISIVAETVSINEMYNIDAVDPKTRIMANRVRALQEEADLWGFIGEASDDLLDTDEDLTNISDEEILQMFQSDDEDDDEDFEDEDLDDVDIDENGNPLQKFGKACANGPFGQLGIKAGKAIVKHKTQNENSVKSAVDSIMFSLESVSENKILSCSSLTKLNGLESKLNKLKNKYTKYLNRYKKKYKENQESGSKSKLLIRFNNAVISNPKAFMKQYGKYIKIINKRLKLVEKRRLELRKRKGLAESADESEVNVITTLTDMDMKALDFCLESIEKQLNAPDIEIFTLTEARVLSVGDVVTPEDIDAMNAVLGHGDKTLSAARKTTADSKDQKNDQSQKPQDKAGRGREPSSSAFEAGTYYDRAHPRGGNASRVRIRDDHVKPFDREVFTDMDMKRANDAIPIFTKATIGFVIDDTEEVVNRDVLIGVKAYVHKAPSMELINDVYNCIINKRKFLRFVKFISGEERSLSDLLFGIRELKNDALDAKGKSSEWRSAFKRRRRWAKMSIPYLTKEYTPNGIVVMTMNEVNFIKDQYGIDIMTDDHVRMIMDADYLLSFVVIDQAEEMVYVTYDGHGYGFQQYTYAMLEREQQTSDRMMRELYRSLSTR